MLSSPTIAPYSFRWRRFVTLIAVAPILCIVFALKSYVQAQSSDGQTTNTISGTVINSVTQEPIGRALVYTADERWRHLPTITETSN